MVESASTSEIIIKTYSATFPHMSHSHNIEKVAKRRHVVACGSVVMGFSKYALVLGFVYHVVAAAGPQPKCLESGRFYRDPDRPPTKFWTPTECSKYLLCLEGEVFEFKCSSGLLFNVKKQICDTKANVDNCDITSAHASTTPTTNCPANQMSCADGTCLPHHYFCDGSIDCVDGSDEVSCDSAHNPRPAFPCNQTCILPKCFCSHDGTQIPGNLEPGQVPQMVLLTFDDAINFENWDFYDKVLFGGRKNPNGCPMKATFFVSHQYNDYHRTQKLWNSGHEIAVHSITHRSPELWWSQNATIEDWFDEMVGQANILNKFSKIRMTDIRGMRVPFLQIGWNRQFLMMKEFGFEYDSSIVAPFSDPPKWPYTLDHKIPHECTTMKQNCPSRSYPGVWEMVMNQLESDGYACPMIDSCPGELSGNDIYRILIHNFRRHYFTNRAPFGLHLHSRWFKKREYLDAFQDFLTEVMRQKDVWFVTNWQAISWMKNPTPVNQLNSFQDWGCNKLFEKSEIVCNVPNVCKLHSKAFEEDRYLYTCFQCPEHYPWIRNEFGRD